MCEIHDEKSIRTILSKIRFSDYSKYFPDDTYDPLEQLCYIEGMVEKFREEERVENDKMHSIEKDMEKYKNDESRSSALVVVANFYGLIYMYHDALRANMQMAMLAPAIESLYKRTLYILVKEKLGKEALKEFFFKKGFKGSKGKGSKDKKGGAVNRINQALKRLNIKSNFHNDTEKYLAALFGYRNVLFHNGLEWSEEDCKKFSDEKQPSGWFMSHSNSCRPYFILPTEVFVDELMDFFEDSMCSFAKSKQSLG